MTGVQTCALPILITAHNIGFDIRITALMKYLTRSGWDRKSFILDNNNFMATFHKDKTSIFLMDNMQLFNVSLASLGESVGKKKLKVNFDTVDNTTLLTYCKRDVEVMQLAWSKWADFIQSYDLGNFKSTIGSQAFTAFRHRFMYKDIYIHTKEPVIELERRSYHGGRVECFYIGKYDKTKVYNLDVNSMYPYIMQQVKLPHKFLYYHHNIGLKDFMRLHNTSSYICEATIEINKPLLPCYNDKRLCFPIGTVSGVWTKPELEQAMQDGNLLSVTKCSVYAKDILFKEYVDFFYAQRQKFKKEGNIQFAYFSKILMNSLYGKFGQRITEYDIVGKNSDLPDQGGTTFDISKGRNVKFRIIDGIIEQESGTIEGQDSFIAIASFITGAARAYLLRLIKIAGWDNVLYCDTDSLFVNQIGRSRLTEWIDTNRLGKLKVEAVSNSITILGNKRYVFGGKIANKGIRRGASLVGVNTYSQIQFQSFGGALIAGHTDNVKIKQITKTLSGDYTKGTITTSGRVLPLVF